MKNLPALPDNVAKEYEALVTPGVVILQDPKNKLKKRRINLAKITMKQAKELAEMGKFVKKKDSPPASKEKP